MSLRGSLLWGNLCLACLSAFAADPAKEIASFSPIRSIHPEELLGGAILSERGSTMNFDRGLSVQTCYSVRAPADQTAKLLASWNPVSHSELQIYSSYLFGNKEDPKFEELKLDPSLNPVGRLLEQTRKTVRGDSTLQLNARDISRLRKIANQQAAQNLSSEDPNFCKLAKQFLASTLKERYELFLKGGIASLPPYEVEKSEIQVGAEVLTLIGQEPRIARRFKDTLSDTLFRPAGSPPAEPAACYWQLFKSERIASLCLGAIYERKVGDRWQVIDCQMYVTNSYLTIISLYELWPFEAAGRPCTLVWRGDFVSSPSYASLRGVEKMAAGVLMIKSVKTSIQCFQEDAKQ